MPTVSHVSNPKHNIYAFFNLYFSWNFYFFVIGLGKNENERNYFSYNLPFELYHEQEY